MSDPIILITGTAFPKTEKEVLAETAYSNGCATILESSGHKLTRVGMPWRGFYMRHIQEAFQKMPDANLVIVNVHGNIQDGKHSIAPRREKSSHMFAEQFYRSLADFSNNRPLNVFIISCGSGNGCFDAVKFLPLGSTLVNTVKEGDTGTTFPSEGFLESSPNSAKPFAEHLFLNMLSSGYKNSCFYPQISISTPNPSDGDVWSMWDMARTFDFDNEALGPDFQSGAIEYLSDYFSKDTVSMALRCINFYEEAMHLSIQGKTRPDLPITIRSLVYQGDFLRQVREKNLFGAMCAVGYYANRQLIGAFQTGHNLSRPSFTGQNPAVSLDPITNG